MIHRGYYNTRCTSGETGSNLHIPLNPCTVYKRARYLKVRHRDLFTLSTTCFLSRATWPFSRISQLAVEEKGEMVSRARQWGGIAVTLKIQSENSGVRGTTRSRARRRIKGGTNWINVLSGVLQAQDGYTTVGFKLKRPWACRWHGSSRMLLSSDPKVRLIFLIEV